MIPYHYLYALMVGIATAIAAVLAAIAWRKRTLHSAKPLAGLMAGVTIWGSAKLVALTTPGLSGTIFWTNLQFVGILIIPAAWLVFALQYSGQGTWVSRRVLMGLAVEPIAVLGLLWTNDWHGLFRRSTELVTAGPFTMLTSTAGPAFWVHTAYSYLLLGAGTWLIVRLWILSDDRFRGQSLGLLVGVLVPWIGNGLYLSGVVFPAFDITIIAFSITGGVLLWTITQHQLLDLVPLARELARDDFMEMMDDAIIVVDDRNRIIDYNPAAEDLFVETDMAVIGRSLSEAHPSLANMIATVSDEETSVSTEFEFWDGTTFHAFDVRISPLQRWGGVFSGRLISLRDTTEQRQHEQQLSVLTRMLRHNLRNELNIVRGNVILLENALEDTALSQRTETIKETIDSTIARTEKIQSIADASNLTANGPVEVVGELEELIMIKQEEYPAVRITLDTPEEAWTAVGPAIVTALDEVLTNAIEHNDGDAPRVHISVTMSRQNGQGNVRIRVADNGPGLPEEEIEPIVEGEETALNHSSGVGLWLVVWIIREVGGDIEFEETSDGAAVTISLPRAAQPR